MAEVFQWAEATAYIWTGNSTTSALLTFCRNTVNTRQRTYVHYRAPKATAYTDYAIASGANLTIGQAYSQFAAIQLFEGVVGGDVHVHLKHATPNVGTTAGVFLYSGNFASVELNEQEDQLIVNNLAMTFPSWSAY